MGREGKVSGFLDEGGKTNLYDRDSNGEGGGRESRQLTFKDGSQLNEKTSLSHYTSGKREEKG